MASIPLPSLSIRPPENPLDQYAKALSVKSMIGGQQIQQEQLKGAQLENQNVQQSIADRNAMTQALKDWDGQDFNALPSLVLKNGGSANAVFGLRKQILDQKQTLSKIASDDATTGSKNLETIISKRDQIAGSLESLVDPNSVSDDNLHTEATKTVNGLMASGMIDSEHGQQLQSVIDSTKDPKTLRTGIDHYAKTQMGAKALAEQALQQANSGKAVAEANLANQKVKLYSNTKPGDFDQLIDQLVPPVQGNPNSDLNQQAKTMANGLLARGDYEGAAKSLENIQHVVNQRSETNFVQNREDYRQALNRQANQSNQLQKNGLEQLDKVWTDPQHGYTQFLAQANATKTAIADAKDGNELAASLAPLMTVLGVNSFAGVHRINPQEYESAGPGVGSVYRHINTALDKAASGKLNPDTASEMGTLIDQLIKSKYDSLLPASQLIAKNAGLDSTKTTIFDKDGNPNTLDNAAKGVVAPRNPAQQNINPPAGKTTVYDPEGTPHFVFSNKVNDFLADPQYKGWHR
jgi:hypothetical protein